MAVALLRPHQHPADDGLCGSTPHLHGVLSEGYLAVAGRGRLLTIDRDGPATHALDPGSVIWCPPGTVTRLVDDGGLVVALLVEHGALDDIVVLGDEHIDRSLPRTWSSDAHARAVDHMRELREDLVARDVQSYVALHRGVPAALAHLANDPAVASALDPGPRPLERLVERLAADDAHHLLDASAIRGFVRPACADIVGDPVGD